LAAITTAVVHEEDRRAVILLRGEWDFSTKRVLADVLSRAIASGEGGLVIDLSEAEFIDTAAGRALAVCRGYLDRQDRSMAIWSPSRLAIRVLDLFGLTDLIDARGIGSPHIAEYR